MATNNIKSEEWRDVTKDYLDGKFSPSVPNDTWRDATEDYLSGRLGYSVAEEPEKGFFSNVATLAKQGGEKLVKGLPLAADVAMGRFSEDAPRQLSESLNTQSFQPKELKAATKNISGTLAPDWELAEGPWESTKVLGNMLYNVGREAVTNPKGIAYLTAEQVANMVPAIAGMFAGGKLGALGGPAAPLTVPAGAMGGMVAGSMVPEMALEVGGFVQKELSKRGMAPTESNIRELLQDSEISSDIISKTRKKAAGTAITDAALTMVGGRLASRPLALMKKGPVSLGTKAAYGGAGVATGMAGEPISEMAGQKLATGEVDMGEAAMELAGGFGGSFAEVPAAARFARSEARDYLKKRETPPTPPAEQPSVAPQQAQQDAFNTAEDFARAYTEGMSEEELKGKRDEYAKRPDADPQTLSDVDALFSEIRQEAPKADTFVDDGILQINALRDANAPQSAVIEEITKLVNARPDKADQIKAAFPDVPTTLTEAVKKSKEVVPFTEESDDLNKSIIDNIAGLKANENLFGNLTDFFKGGTDGTLQTETEIENVAPTADAQDSIKGIEEAAGTAMLPPDPKSKNVFERMPEDQLLSQADVGVKGAIDEVARRKGAATVTPSLPAVETSIAAPANVAAKKIVEPAATGEGVKKLAHEWDMANRVHRSDSWFDGAHTNEESIAGFSEALNVGADQLQAHGMAKEPTLSGAIDNLANILTNGLDQTRRGGVLDTAPLVNRPGEGLVGATASGSAYSEGPFQLVAKHGVLGIRSRRRHSGHPC